MASDGSTVVEHSPNHPKVQGSIPATAAYTRWENNNKKNIETSAAMLALSGRDSAGNTKVGSITVPLSSCLTGLESAV